MNNYNRGHFAEFIAGLYLRLKGYHQIAVNHTFKRGSGVGEIDLIFKHKQTLIFVEVKQRQTIAQASYSIFPAQQKRIRRAAEVFIKQNKHYMNYDIRFDVVLIKFPFCIMHIKNAF
ncbi:MAG: YraN family protein [Alphaproteobacteria bacterium]|nr:YraN family protein [Alphaproteobacteria bacterium]